jgi:probable F420-dependent oxidoreductase
MTPMPTLPHHPFRFGCLNFSLPSGAEFAARARLHEDLGYSTLLLSDHVFNCGPITGMVAAALATTRLRVGTCVLGNDFWNPAIIARELLTIDQVSDGRLEFGLGSGWYASDYTQSGIAFDSPGVRISRLEESVAILKGLLSGETVTFNGAYYHLDQLDLAKKPVQQPHPPIMIGGGGRRILSLAARQADIISFNARATSTGGLDPSSTTLQATQEKVDWVCQAAGERLPGLEFNVLASVIITSDQEAAARKAGENWKWTGNELTADQVLESPASLIGEVEEIVEKIQKNRERFGFSYYTIFENDLETFAPVVKRLAGK